MPFDELDTLKRVDASQLFEARLIRDGKAAITERKRQNRKLRLASAFALAASLAVGLWLGGTDPLNFEASTDDDATFLAEGLDLYANTFAEWEG